ncbi:hypothetical protein B0H14DRAFT_2604955 [Mycena olivaceomarginata]|nr:hypothetical protein B0H14DRAFT_2604955 [Mycena olivaceomarginata]
MDKYLFLQLIKPNGIIAWDLRTIVGAYPEGRKDFAIALDAFETAPLLSSLDLTGGFRIVAPCTILLPWAHITRYYGDFAMWDDHVTALEHLRNVVDCAITLTNWAPNENEDILDLPRLRRLYVARGDFLEFTAPLLQELVVEPLQMTPPPDALTNISDLINRSSCQLQSSASYRPFSPVRTYKNSSPSSNYSPLSRTFAPCLEVHEHMNLDELVTALAVATPRILPRMERLTIGEYACYEWSALIDMVDWRLHANPLRLEMLRSAGLDLTVIGGPGAHEAMVNVPFFRAGTSSDCDRDSSFERATDFSHNSGKGVVMVGPSTAEEENQARQRTENASKY